ncbi:hypothetical protein IWQ60_001664 [Tieghemiomyces parasiticus]|uniref:ATP-dependent (S)-NAD(P)H-hydrate dehydratase n=1 Tax=Tieghemiomyces parasiticus TaxID=78921 RepID=A0A9W8DWD2_9FUNG|nr:hypothetical protein IWQ60_001664 [Tieghemiomyces parasiticus]
MVHPYLRKSALHKDGVVDDDGSTVDSIVERVAQLLPRLHVLVVGPGLSRDDLMLQCTAEVINKAKERNIPIVVDADGLYALQRDPQLLAGYPNCIITPNINEFKRLCEATDVSTEDKTQGDAARALSRALGGVTVIQKGRQDIVSNGEEILVCEEEGGLKRCGGQGDVLSGVLGTFMAWGVAYQSNVWKHGREVDPQRIPMLAAYAGCCVTRRASRKAFEKFRRATMTVNLLDFIQAAYEELFPDTF